MRNLQHTLDRARQHLLGQQFARALPLYQSLIRQAPGEAVIWFEYGNAASKSNEPGLADRAWKKALELAPRNADLIGLIGHQYQASRKPDQARACFERAALADPRGINPRISLAVLYEQQHHLEQARRMVEECLSIDPGDDQGRYFSAVIDRREGKLEDAERRLRDLIASDPKHPFVRYAARYELAQISDRSDRPDEAMRFLAEAKQIVGGLTNTDLLAKGYDQSAERARHFTLAQPRDILQRWAAWFPAEKREPIPRLAFLGGHPRSGTTLLEQVLDAHPEIAALDEPPAFLEILQPEFHKSKDLSIARINTLRRLYSQALLLEAGPGAAAKLLVDKNPSPTARLPLWLRVFPDLRVLIALRDPRDVVLSCYFQNIPLNATNVNFLSFDRLVKHYAGLMDIWLAVREWEGFAWTEVRYEDIVTNLEAEGRRSTAFLGLGWHEGQARFYEKSRTKQLYSPTYQDVTRPVYTRSIARWHAYERYLAPILPALEPYCRTFGYA